MWADVRDHVQRLNHDAFRFEAGGMVVYTDPFKVPARHDADLVLISHEHFDHCAPEDVAAVSKPGTVVVAAASCRDQLASDARLVQPGDRLEVAGVSIEVVPAYNKDKHFHPRDAGHVGFVFTLDGVRVYFAGDTDLIPEMTDIRADVALLPVSGTYVMTADEAVQAARDVGAEVTIPMHYGDIIGTARDAEALEKRFEGQVVIMG
jgi:L-ascorbate metabolism protein UlaG (beta-lactamase superfamily)